MHRLWGRQRGCLKRQSRLRIRARNAAKATIRSSHRRFSNVTVTNAGGHLPRFAPPRFRHSEGRVGRRQRTLRGNSSGGIRGMERPYSVVRLETHRRQSRPAAAVGTPWWDRHKLDLDQPKAPRLNGKSRSVSLRQRQARTALILITHLVVRYFSRKSCGDRSSNPGPPGWQPPH